MFRTLSIILTGNVGGAILSLLRNLLIARLLPVEDYGIAATFAIAVAIVEMLSTLGLQQQIVQSKNGGNPQFQAVLQGFHLARGVISGGVLFFAASWIAAFLEVPELTWAYQMMAIVPILSGFSHYDIFRLKRQMRHGPAIITELLPHTVALIAVWPLYQILPDYRLMLAIIIGHVILRILTAHLIAERPYRIAFDRTIVQEAIRFGWPLLINNLMLFFVFNGEKLIVGRELGMADLAILAMGFTLTLTPTLVIAKSAQTFFLPQLSAAHQEDHSQFQTLFYIVTQAVCAMTVLFLCAAVLILPILIIPVLDDKFAALVPLVGWLAILQAVRVLKTGASVAALATGFTTNPMIANSVRAVSLPVAWFVAIQTGAILPVIFVAIGAEAIGLLISIVLLKRRLGLSLRPLLYTALTMAVVLASTAYAAILAPLDGRHGPLEILFVLGTSFCLIMTLTHLLTYMRKRYMTTFADT